MTLLIQILMLYSWGGVCLLLFFLFSIARFFERRLSEANSTQKQMRYYPFFILSMILFATSAGIYLFSENFVVGHLTADVLRILGGIILGFTGYSLLTTMVGR